MARYRLKTALSDGRPVVNMYPLTGPDDTEGELIGTYTDQAAAVAAMRAMSPKVRDYTVENGVVTPDDPDADARVR